MSLKLLVTTTDKLTLRQYVELYMCNLHEHGQMQEHIVRSVRFGPAINCALLARGPHLLGAAILVPRKRYSSTGRKVRCGFLTPHLQIYVYTHDRRKGYGTILGESLIKLAPSYYHSNIRDFHAPFFGGLTPSR